MPSVDSSQFLREIKNSKNPPSLLLAMGEEETLLQDCLKNYENTFFARYGKEFPEFNHEVLNGTRDSADKIIEACSTLPFGSEKKLVIVHRLEKIPEASRKEIAEYLQNVSPSTCAVFLWNDRPGQTLLANSLVAAVGKSGTVVKCWKPFEDRRPDWIRQELAREGRKISAQAAELLSEEGGESLAELKSEIEKLILYAGSRTDIQTEDVRRTMSFKRGESVWDLTDAIEKGDKKEAGKILKNCLQQGEEPLLLLNLIARSLRKNREMMGEKKTAQAFHQMKKLDRLFKSGHGTESAAFERLIQLL